MNDITLDLSRLAATVSEHASRIRIPSGREFGHMFYVLLIVYIFCYGRQKRRCKNLDRPLFHWSKRDKFSVRDLLNGGLLILGITGSGKTSSSGKQIASALAHDRNAYGLILAAKPEDLGMWQKIFADAGQSKRLLVFDAEDSPLRFNFLEEAGRRGSTRDIVQCITTIGETLRAGERRGGGENEAFFAAQQERLIHHAVEVLKVARGTVTSADLQQFITAAAHSPDQIKDPAWKSGFHSQCLEAAFNAPKTRQDAHDFDQAADYWLFELPRLADRTRSSILAGVFATLFVFNNGLVHERVSTASNFSFDELRRKRQWLFVNTPPSVLGESGTFIGTGFKYLMQKDILRRTAGAKDPFHVCWCDECQLWTNDADSRYIAQSRSHRGTTVFLTQSLHSFHSAMTGERGKHQALSLLGNFATRVCHALGDIETAEWASNTLGKRLETHVGGSTQPAESAYDELMGYAESTSSFSTQYEPVLQPAVFMNGLRNGGPLNRYRCDAIVIRPGKPFSNGENWLHVTFRQR